MIFQSANFCDFASSENYWNASSSGIEEVQIEANEELLFDLFQENLMLWDKEREFDCDKDENFEDFNAPKAPKFEKEFSNFQPSSVLYELMDQKPFMAQKDELDVDEDDDCLCNTRKSLYIPPILKSLKDRKQKRIYNKLNTQLDIIQCT